MFALPKIGLNRHTPHASIFGPLSQGRFNFHNIYSDQISKHIEKLRDNIWRKDSVGQAFLYNLTAYEIVNRSSKDLFDIKPWNCNYGEKYSEIFFYGSNAEDLISIL